MIVIFGLLFMPESPRWQMAHGKTEEALAMLIRFRESSQSASHPGFVGLKTSECDRRSLTPTFARFRWEQGPFFPTGRP